MFFHCFLRIMLQTSISLALLGTCNRQWNSMLHYVLFLRPFFFFFLILLCVFLWVPTDNCHNSNTHLNGPWWSWCNWVILDPRIVDPIRWDTAFPTPMDLTAFIVVWKVHLCTLWVHIFNSPTSALIENSCCDCAFWLLTFCFWVLPIAYLYCYLISCFWFLVFAKTSLDLCN